MRVRKAAEELVQIQPVPESGASKAAGLSQLLNRPVDRRTATAMVGTALAAGVGLLNAAFSPFGAPEDREKAGLAWDEF
ncbi:MAG: hypothetical protein HC834_04115, partial [Rhodospirillales bacterium]|nr:hypothetical protein [Rhodospirillales bacterium]